MKRTVLSGTVLHNSPHRPASHDILNLEAPSMLQNSRITSKPLPNRHRREIKGWTGQKETNSAKMREGIPKVTGSCSRHLLSVSEEKDPLKGFCKREE